MDLEILMATIDCTDPSEIACLNKGIDASVLIINQSSGHAVEESSFRVETYDETGLSKSRNKALKLAEGKICLLADDDVEYPPGAFQTILDAFARNSDADLILFQIITADGKAFKKYPKHSKWVSPIGALSASSPNLAFRLDSIRKKGIWFDERFGLRSNFPSGEQVIFVSDCLKRGLKVWYEAYPVVIHPVENSGNSFSDELLRARGAMHIRIFGSPGNLVFDLLFLTKKAKAIAHSVGLLNGWRCMRRGAKEITGDQKQ